MRGPSQEKAPSWLPGVQVHPFLSLGLRTGRCIGLSRYQIPSVWYPACFRRSRLRS